MNTKSILNNEVMKTMITTLIVLCLLPFGVFGATYTVTNNNDSGSGSLRQAISDASDGDEIVFNLGSGSETITLLSELSITKSLTIDGSNVAGSGTPVTVQVTTPGSSTYRIFNLNAAYKTMNISDMIIKGGNVSGDWGGSIKMAEGSLSLNRVTIQGSKAEYGGGICGVKVAGPMSLTITNSTIDACESTNNGGGVCGNGITLLLSNSTFKGNSTSSSGGAIATDNTTDFDITNCTFFDNTATSYGGGFCMMNGSCNLSNCTFSHNSSTISQGGGVGLSNSGGALTFKNCILANNTGYDYYYGEGALTDNGYNVVESQNTTLAGKGFQSTNNLLNTDPTGLASTLSYEGGYNEVLKVTAGNILSNPGSTTETTDQRGCYRKSGTVYYGTIPTSTTNYITRGAYQYNGITARTNTVDNWTSASNNYYTDLQGAENHVSAGTTVKLAGTSILLSEVDISQSITLTGEGTESTTLRVAEPGITNSRVFNINAPGSTINISNMTIRGGDLSSNYGGAIYFEDGTLNLNYVTVSDSKAYYGGGIYMATPAEINNLFITNSTISGNTATNNGGGLYCIYTCTVENSTISGNTAVNGGGVYNNNHGDGGTCTIENTTISGNNATTDGGGLYNNGTCTIENSLINLNEASNDGGGLYNADPLTITNSTISGNTSVNRGAGVANTDPCTITNSTINGNTATAHGGGIWSNDECTIVNTTIYDNTANSSSYGGGGLLNSGTFTIINSTISGNHAPNKYGGGVYNFSNSLTVKNSMIADNTANSTGLDYYYNGGTLTDYGYNIIEDQDGTTTGAGKTFTAVTNIIGQQANLFGTGLTSQTLDDNGGPTQTLAIEVGSVAIDAGTQDAEVTTDQRGYFRSDTPTIGAYEFSGSNTITWDGSLNTNWNTTDNWDCETVPTSSYNVIIPGSLSNYPVIASGTGASTFDLSVNNGASLNLNSGASLITNGTITNNGTITVSRTITYDTWHLISVPVTSATAATFEGDYLQYWTEASHTWTDITATTDVLTPVQGYALWSGSKGGASTYTFTGTPNTGALSISITDIGTGGVYDGANLVGNPYPSSIDWNTLSSTYGTVYYWDSQNSQYDTWNGSTGTNGGQQYLPPLQGFFIIADGNGTFNLSNSNRVHNNATSFYKGSSAVIPNSIGLVAENSTGHSDEYILVLDDESSVDFEFAFDAWKLNNGVSGAPEISGLIEQGKLAIDKRPMTDHVQLAFLCDQSGFYSIGISQIADITTATLEDTKENTFTDLTKGAYSFAWETTDDESRFILHLGPTGLSALSQPDNLLIYTSGKNLYLKPLEGTTEGTLRMTDMAGRTLWQEEMHLEGLTTVPVNLKPGLYVVSFQSDASSAVKKVIIN